MRRSGFNIMLKMIGLVKPLILFMLCTILTGTIAFFAAIFISIFGGYTLLNVLGIQTGITNESIFIIVIICVVIVSTFRYVEQISGHYIAFKILAVIRDEIFGVLRKLAPAKLEGKDKGNLISVITSDIELLEVFYAHTIAPIAQAILSVAVLTVFIGSFHPVLGLIAFLGYMVVGVAIPYINGRFGRDSGRVFRGAFGDLNSYILESLRGLRETLQYGNGNKRREEINNRSKDLISKQEDLKKRGGISAACTDSSVLLFSLVMLLVGITLMKHGSIGFDSVVITTIAMMSSFGPVIAISNLSNDLLLTLACGERVLNLLEEEPMVNDITGKHNLSQDGFEGIVVKHLSFSYDKELILDNINLEIPSNQIIGIHGVSGSGKSTLLKLLMSFWRAKEGTISFKDENLYNIEDINTKSLRKFESFVTQETYLFHISIGDNIKIGKLNATKEEVIEAAKKASIHDFIMSLPDGYETNVSELGSSLSGGERQRIGLARAFLHDAPIMLLDEPTSNLDSLNEAIILKALKEECKDKTVVLVSHRKSTMNISDKVYQMESKRLS
jgi:ATP-binding cassette subfamily C protein